MKGPSLAFAGLYVFLASCEAEAPRPEKLVSDFKAPSLQGLIVRDHPKGAQVVKRFEAPWTVYEACVVFTSVNGTTVRDAAHFRELADAAVDAAMTDPEGELSITSEILPPNQRGDCERKARQ